MTDSLNIPHSEGALIHSGSDEQPYNNYDSPDSHKYSRIDAIHECSLPIPIPKPKLPPLQKLGTRRLQINPAYFKTVPDPIKEYKYYIASDLKSQEWYILLFKWAPFWAYANPFAIVILKLIKQILDVLLHVVSATKQSFYRLSRALQESRVHHSFIED
jgi:hypothetical protein